MNTEHLQNKTKQNWLKTLSFASLFLIGMSCSTDEVIVTPEAQVSSAKSDNSVELSISNITASTQQSANPVTNAYDNDSGSRWSGNGRAVTFDIDLGSTNAIDYLMISYYKGNERQAFFDYYYSTNGTSWTGGKSKTSTGNTTSLELFDLDNSTSARYIRLVCKGTSSSSWNSILDVEVYGTPGNNEGGNNYTSVPAKIEAEDYDAATEGRTQTQGSVTNVGWIDSGESLSYNINVPASGTYDIDFRVASASNNSKFDIYQGNSKVGNISTSSTGGWNTWKTVTASVDLSSGNQTLKLEATGSGWNINWLQVKNSDDNGGPIAGGSPEDIVGDFWKITLPIDLNGDGSGRNVTTYNARNNDAGESYDLNGVVNNTASEFDSGVDTNDYLYVDNDWLVFKAFCGGATTENSQYPRSELRGLSSGGDDNYFSMENHQELEVTVKVLDVPTERPEVNMVQIHGPYDEPLRVEFNDGSTGSNQGLHLTVNESDDNHNNVIDYSIGQELKVWVKVQSGHLWLTLTNLSNGDTYATDYDVEDETGYWKVGCYLQGSITYCDVKSGDSFCRNGGESDDYDTTGAVAVKDLSLIRDGQTYK